MKIMTVLGSPKTGGNTAGALAMFEKLVGDGHEIDRVNIADHEIAGCKGCYACQSNPDEPSCILTDDANDIYRRLLGCDAVIYAAPLYMWGFPSGIHAFMERHLSMVTGYMTPAYKSLLEGKRIALLMTCGGPVESNTDAVKIVFDRFAAYGKGDMVGNYFVPGCTTPDEIEEKAADVVKKLAADIVA